MSYVTLNDVTFVDVLPSGKSFRARFQGQHVIIPYFALHDDSELWDESGPGDTGTIVIREDIAIEKGLIDAPTGSLGGIPLKRQRLPDPPKLMDEEILASIEARLNDCSGHPAGWIGSACGQGTMWVKDDTEDAPIALFEGETADDDLDFVAHAPDDIGALLAENKRLREWVAKALKTQERRRK